MLSVSVLGPVEVKRDGEPLPVRPGKTAEVLIRLALDAGFTVRTERLIEDLWGDDAVTTQRNTLQTKVSRLRRELGDPEVVTGSPTGYTLHLDASAIDALEAPRMAEAARELLDAGEAAGALELCTAALALFRGDVLCDAGDGEWLVPHRARLDEVRLRLLEDQLRARVALGAAGEIIPELESLVASQPLREGLWSLLIVALYRDGRQADALAAYRRVRAQLLEELGVDPGSELQALEQQVLMHDRALSGSVVERTTLTVDNNLPALSSTLVGRAADLENAVGLLGTHRLVTLVGSAGVGKTRLAIEVAREIAGRTSAWFVPLETASTAATLVDAIGTTLGLRGADEAAVVDRVRAQDAVVLLDNCEHLIEDTASLVTRLLGAVPGLRVLATSQVPLGIDGETIAIVEPLAMDDSVSLFAARAAERRASFALDSKTKTSVEELCRALDGLPLAIELAAARTKILSVEEIARRLDDRFALLQDPTSRGPERRRALGAAIGWSYDMLFPDEQRGLWALAAFVGGARLDAVEHVLQALDVSREAAIDVVNRLVDRSLVAVDETADGSSRYRLLDSVRAFARERSVDAGVDQAADAARAAWFADAATIARFRLRGPEQAHHLVFARAERSNLESALEWAAGNDPLLGLQIANGFGWAWLVHGEGVVGADRVRRALEATSDAPPGEQVTALSLLGWLQAAGDIARARADAELALDLAETTDDERLIGAARIALAFVFTQLGPPEAVRSVLDDWRDANPSMAETWEAGTSWVLSAHAALASGDLDRARTACAEAERVVEQLGDDWGRNHLEGLLGFVAQAEGRFDDAIEHLTRAAEAARRLDFAATEGFHLSTLGRVLQQTGDDIAAVNTLERAIEIGVTTGELRVASLARVRLGRVLRSMGAREDARLVLELADGWYRTEGSGGRALASRDGAALAACLLAAMSAEDGEPDSVERLGKVLVAARADGDAEIELLTLDALARVQAAAGDDAEAQRLLVLGDELHARLAWLVSDADRLDAAAARHSLP